MVVVMTGESENIGAEEVAQWLEALADLLEVHFPLAALLEDLGSIPTSHMAAGSSSKEPSALF